ncbi:hypothetical protein N7468_000814 [Penicillium chermesinum]|uniref:Xylanolytic transcriptional activator regulatory domain-containing protein n=1 Tax=Penicillium chermesinum TaxID=63820 RepID=A0A9W9PH58_9EURO|nr:uncharacterized protein N7468_000814 [Penicillium chermesinum]KAJ5245831.1 hypothetical protein N7468_000814 [Penicillium chermesinum]KAJ6144130.1 hypothetical protein N7470_008025 [Penicillium chermesinum]
MSKDALFDRIEELEAQLRAAERSSPPRPYDHSPDPKWDPLNISISDQLHPDPLKIPFFSNQSLAQEMNQIFEDSVLSTLAAHSPSREYTRADASKDAELGPFFTQSEGGMFIKAYLETMHNQLPFADTMELYNTHDERLGSTVTLAPQDASTRWRYFKLYMVYAIGAATCRISQKSTSVSSKDLLRTALKYKSPLTELRSLQSIEAMLLLTMYNCRVPTSSMVSSMVSAAMRTAITLGLHREAGYTHLKPEESRRQRRLFWSVYLMDRSIARLLDRPFTIGEHEIDVRLPDYEEPSQTFRSRQSFLRDRGTDASEDVFLPIIRLVRLKSQIQTRVRRVGMEVSLLLPEINPLYSALKEFKSSLKSNLSPIDNDWINLQWHNGIRILLQPLLRDLPPDHELIQSCMKASGQMCQFFKGLHQKGYMGFGFVLVSLLFQAGLTLCYCLFKSSQPCSASVANDLGACSSVLFAVAERNQQAQKYRDTWEAVLTKVMGHLDEVSRTNERRMWSFPQSHLEHPYVGNTAGEIEVQPAYMQSTGVDGIDRSLHEVNSLLFPPQGTIVPTRLLEPSYPDILETINDAYYGIQRDGMKQPLRELEAGDILAFGKMSSASVDEENRYELHPGLFDELFASSAG